MNDQENKELEDLKKENLKLKEDINKWKDSWFSQREIIGRLGYDNLPASYKKQEN